MELLDPDGGRDRVRAECVCPGANDQYVRCWCPQRAGDCVVEAQTVTIQGMLVGEAGQPLSGVPVFATDRTIGAFGFTYNTAILYA